MQVNIRKWPYLIKASFNHFSYNNPLLLASSTAFFATFSLAPTILIIITLFGFFISDRLIKQEVLEKLRVAFGKDTASSIESILVNIQGLTENWYVSVLGFIFLVFIATTLLIVVQTSLNQIWGIKQKPRRHLQRIFIDRFISLIIIMASGLLILASFLTHAVIAFIKRYLQLYFPQMNLSLMGVLNEIVSFIIVVVWFAIIYRFLPAGKIVWRAVWVGSFITGLLFTAGRLIVVSLVQNSRISSVYGASGSIILILLFVFYAALIFYLGAAFTKVYADNAGIKIIPKSYAVKIKIIEED